MRNKSIIIRVTENEAKLFKTEAARAGVSVAAFVRLLLKQWSNGITFEKDKNNTEGKIKEGD
jgi:hypothetical protein